MALLQINRLADNLWHFKFANPTFSVVQNRVFSFSSGNYKKLLIECKTELRPTAVNIIELLMSFEKHGRLLLTRLAIDTSPCHGFAETFVICLNSQCEQSDKDGMIHYLKTLLSSHPTIPSGEIDDRSLG